MKVKVEIFLELKFKFSQILLGDKNTTYLCSKITSTLFNFWRILAIWNHCAPQLATMPGSGVGCYKSSKAF